MNVPLFDHEFLLNYIFFPMYRSLSNPYWINCGDAKLSCYYHKFDPSAKTIIHFHGNGETVGGVSEHFAKIIELMGCNCFFAEYRGYGMSSGKPNLTTMLSDAEIIIRELDLPLEKIILYGRSFGTLSAIHLSQQFPNISGLVLESGIADLSKWGIYNEAPDRIGIDKDTLGKDINKYFNNKEKLSSFSGATLILHTLYDYLVHVSNANQLFEWAPHPKKKVIFEHGNHSDIYISNLLEFTGEVKKFIKKL